MGTQGNRIKAGLTTKSTLKYNEKYLRVLHGTLLQLGLPLKVLNVTKKYLRVLKGTVHQLGLQL